MPAREPREGHRAGGASQVRRGKVYTSESRPHRSFNPGHFAFDYVKGLSAKLLI